jgi:hypothetical protein
VNRLKMAVTGTALICFACGSMSVDQATPMKSTAVSVGVSAGAGARLSPVDHPTVLPQSGSDNIIGIDPAAPKPNHPLPSETIAPQPVHLWPGPVVGNPCSGNGRIKAAGIMCPMAAP